MSPTDLSSLLAELAPLAGGRLQRVDLIDEDELVLELRHVGTTYRLLISAHPGRPALARIDARPPRRVEGGELQRALRRRLVAQPLVALEQRGRSLFLDVAEVVAELHLDGRRPFVVWHPPSGRPVPAPPSPESLPRALPLLEAAARASAVDTEAARRALQTKLLSALGARRKKLVRLRGRLADDAERLRLFEDARKQGELLKPVLGRLRRGQTEAVVTDWETGEPRTVALAPELSPTENLARLFQRAKKAERGLPQVAARQAEVERQLAALEEERRAIEAEPLEALEQRRRAPPRAHEPRRKVKSLPIDRVSRAFRAADGSEIRVGKGAKENDRLTFGAARGDDLWLHASGTPGAHVILRLEKGHAAHPEALLDAATLAAHYSGARAQAKVEITWTEARYVKKHKGDPPGRVSVARARTLLVTVDQARLDRLFERTGGLAGPR